MITCAIESSDILIDDAFENEINRFIKKLVRKDKEVRFLCCRTFGSKLSEFTSICLEVIDQYRKKHPNNQISILYVTHKSKIWDQDDIVDRIYSRTGEGNYFDGVLFLPEENFQNALKSTRAELKKQIRLMIQQSDILLCYFYEIYNQFRAPEIIRSTIRRNDHLKIVNLKQKSTELVLHELSLKLDDRSRYVLNELLKKKTIKEIANALQISKPGVRQIYNYSTRKMRKMYFEQNRNKRIE